MNDWKKWCRLCSKENNDQIDIFIKTENFYNFPNIIQKNLSINITEYDEAPTKICLSCHEILTSLISFSIQSTKVQEMFSELILCEKLHRITDLDSLREKYGLQYLPELLKLNKSEQEETEKISSFYQNNEDNDEIPVNVIKTRANRLKRSSKILNKKNDDAENYDYCGSQFGSIINQTLLLFDKTIWVCDFFKKSQTEIVLSISNEEKKNVSGNINNENKNFENEPIVKIKKVSIRSKPIVKEKTKTDFICPNNDENPSTDSLSKNCKKKLVSEKILISKTQISNCSANNDNNNVKIKNIQCEHCVRKFKTMHGLRLHLKNYHSNINGPTKLPCPTCGRQFNGIANLRNHENTHLPAGTKPWWYCSQCDEKFKNRSYITTHIKDKHQTVKLFICDQCGKGFNFRYHLEAHKIVHSEERTFQCMKCPKKFKSNHVLQNHIDSHEDTKYVCPICKIVLNTKATLRKHALVHSNVQKHKCNFCDKSFRHHTTFKNHLIMHTGFKPHNCPFCDLTFVHGANSRKHQKQCHAVELAKLEETGRKSPCKNIPNIEILRAANSAVINSVNEFKDRSSSPKID